MDDANDKIFDAVCNAMPGVTCRIFSEYCGMSEGYWGSVKAQGLMLSVDALLHLAEMLEYKRRIGGKDVSEQQLVKAIDLIADEIAGRRGSLNVSNEAVRKTVLAAMARRALNADQMYGMPPVILGWT